MNDRKQTILFILAFIGAFVWLSYAIMNPIKYIDLPLEKRIQYERMIFP